MMFKKAMEKKKQEFISVCQVFEFPDIVEEAAQLVDDCNLDLDSITACWKHVEKCAETFDSFNATLWTEVKADEMEGAKKDYAHARQVYRERLAECDVDGPETTGAL